MSAMKEQLHNGMNNGASTGSNNIKRRVDFLSCILFAGVVLTCHNMYYGFYVTAVSGYGLGRTQSAPAPTTTATQLQQQAIEQQQQQQQPIVDGLIHIEQHQQRPKAVVHVGPHKTGSTFVQNMIHDERYLSLAADRYTFPNLPSTSKIASFPVTVFNATSKTSSVVIQYRSDPKNMADLAACFNPNRNKETGIRCNDSIEETIWRGFETFLDESHKNSSNILLSSEEFDRADLDVLRLKVMLEPRFDTRIVVYYRRFFTWIASLHNEISKASIKNGNTFPNIIDFIMKEGNLDYWGQLHTGPVYQRYSKHFPVTVIGLDDIKETKTSLLESFFCEGIDAKISCDKMRARATDAIATDNAVEAVKQTQQAKDAMNPSQSLDIYELVNEIRGRGKLVSKALQLTIQKRLEAMKERNPGKMKKICLERLYLDKLILLSIQYEEELDDALSKTRNAFIGRNSNTAIEPRTPIREEFREKAHKLFCSINTKLIIDEWEEQGWFRKLIKSSNEPPLKVFK